MMERLNPKLTRRQSASALLIGNENIDQSQLENNTVTTSTTVTSYTNTSTNTSSQQSVNIVNPNLHLLHNGKWIAKQVTSLI